MIIKKFKRGIAMIELIFALVIMGIALMSAPMLIHQSIESSNVALQQEAIASIATNVGIILSKPWDAEDANRTAGEAPIMELNSTRVVAGSPFNLAGIPSADLNVRTSSQSGATIMASMLGHDDGNDSEFNDIDDYHSNHTIVTIFNEENSTLNELGDYIDIDIDIFTKVTFADDRPASFTTNGSDEINASNKIFNTSDLNETGNYRESNIKFVNALLTGNKHVAELEKNITLKAFSCNIGTFKIEGIQY